MTAPLIHPRVITHAGGDLNVRVLRGQAVRIEGAPIGELQVSGGGTVDTKLGVAGLHVDEGEFRGGAVARVAAFNNAKVSVHAAQQVLADHSQVTISDHGYNPEAAPLQIEARGATVYAEAPVSSVDAKEGSYVAIPFGNSPASVSAAGHNTRVSVPVEKPEQLEVTDGAVVFPTEVKSPHDDWIQYSSPDFESRDRRTS